MIDYSCSSFYYVSMLKLRKCQIDFLLIWLGHFEKKMERVRSWNNKTYFFALTLQEPHFRDEDKTLVNRTYLYLSKPYWEAELEFSSRTFVFVNYAAISNEVSVCCSTDRFNQSRLTETKRQRFMGSCTKWGQRILLCAIQAWTLSDT